MEKLNANFLMTATVQRLKASLAKGTENGRSEKSRHKERETIPKNPDHFGTYNKQESEGAAAYQLGNTSSRTITEVRQR